MYNFIQHAHIKMFKSERKGIFNVTKDLLFQINAVDLTLYSSKDPEKKTGFHRNMKQHYGF